MTDEYTELTPADLTHQWRERTVLESVDKAVAEAVGDGQPGVEYATRDAALRWLRDCAWYDLQQAIHRAANGKWSIECEGQVGRIVGLTSLVGPAPWGDVPVDLLLDGTYERIHELIGNPTPLTDNNRAAAQAVKDRNGGIEP